MGKINVAIVDDNERIVSLLDNICSADEAIEVVGKAEDGMKALDVIRKTEPDVVLLDLIMPKLDGLEVMQRINSDSRIKKHPAFIVISAIGKESITEDAFSHGAVYFIMKPFQNETVINKIKQVSGQLPLYRQLRQRPGFLFLKVYLRWIWKQMSQILFMRLGFRHI